MNNIGGGRSSPPNVDPQKRAKTNPIYLEKSLRSIRYLLLENSRFLFVMEPALPCTPKISQSLKIILGTHRSDWLTEVSQGSSPSQKDFVIFCVINRSFRAENLIKYITLYLFHKCVLYEVGKLYIWYPNKLVGGKPPIPQKPKSRDSAHLHAVIFYQK